jgi:hypothetical protein
MGRSEVDAQGQAAGFHYEFFGPYGPALIVVALPVVVAGLVFACNPVGCLRLWPSLEVPGFPPGTHLYEHEAMLAVLGWFLLILLLHKLLPGQTLQGVKLPSSGRLSYKLNGKFLIKNKQVQLRDNLMRQHKRIQMSMQLKR